MDKEHLIYFISKNKNLIDNNDFLKLIKDYQLSPGIYTYTNSPYFDIVTFLLAAGIDPNLLSFNKYNIKEQLNNKFSDENLVDLINTISYNNDYSIDKNGNITRKTFRLTKDTIINNIIMKCSFNPHLYDVIHTYGIDISKDPIVQRKAKEIWGK